MFQLNQRTNCNLSTCNMEKVILSLSVAQGVCDGKGMWKQKKKKKNKNKKQKKNVNALYFSLSFKMEFVIE
jgi:hypothetical protein